MTTGSRYAVGRRLRRRYRGVGSSSCGSSVTFVPGSADAGGDGRDLSRVGGSGSRRPGGQGFSRSKCTIRR